LHFSNRDLNIRDFSLDAVRAFATLLVITIHIAAPGFSIVKPHWWAINAYDSVARVSVPLFFMVSGALLLPREHSVGSLFRRLTRIIFPLLVWSFVYIASLKIRSAENDSWFLAILKGPVSVHLWFLYTLIGAYIFLPVMSGFYRTSTASTKAFTLSAWFIGASALPLVNSITGIRWVGFDFSFMPLYAGYIVLGAVLYRDIEINVKVAWSAACVWALCTSFTAYLTWDRLAITGIPSEMFYGYSSPTVVFGAAAAFICIRHISNWSFFKGKLFYRAISFFSKTSFGVYLSHPLLIFILEKNNLSYSSGNPWVTIPLLSLIVLCVCSVFVAIAQRIPLIRLSVPN
jgi:surface polysaccharide O-acyltransferase-like enzyme